MSRAGALGAPALVVAHPGHELRLHGWLARTRPAVHVITDGSGATGDSRLASTTRILASTGARPGELYGALTDAELYAAVLSSDVERVFALVDALARSLVATRPEYVVADAAEGYNPAHDLCGAMVAAAAALARRRGSGPIPRYDYPVARPPDDGVARARSGVVQVHLDDAALRRKLDAGGAYRELHAEVGAALAESEATPYRDEFLRPVDPDREPGAPDEVPPFYERHGERRVAEGKYRSVLRWEQHLQPFVRALLRRASGDAS